MTRQTHVTRTALVALLLIGCNGGAEQAPEVDDHPEAIHSPEQGVLDFAGMVESQYARREVEDHTYAFSVRDAVGQNPHILYIGCGDSYCGGAFDSLGIPHAPNRVFKGDNPGNVLFTRVYDSRAGEVVLDGSPSVSYWVNHIAHLGGHSAAEEEDTSALPHGSEVYFVVIEGHTMCGAMNALLGGIDGEDPGLREHLEILRAGTADTIATLGGDTHLEPIARNALLSQAAVDYQVAEFMRLYPNFVSSGRGVVVGMTRDLTNHIFSRIGPLSDVHFDVEDTVESPRRGHVYITNVNGVREHDGICTLLKGVVGERLDPMSLEYVVHRIHAH
jgi:hypothetical protein